MKRIFRKISTFKTIIQTYIRKMVLRFANSISNLTLNTYHIVINFKTNEKIPSEYSLQILAKLRNEIECGYLIQQLQTQITNKFIITTHALCEIFSQIDENQIITQFQSNYKHHVSMKFIFRQFINNGFGGISKVIDNTIPINGVKDYRVNILKTGNIPFSKIEDLFCIEIITDNLK